jgi:hypothetical protein
LWRGIEGVVSAHDVSAVNIECPLTGSKFAGAKTGMSLRADPRCARGISAGGFNVATLANNHILDMGAVGLRDTLHALGEAGVETVGAGLDLTDATRPLTLEVNGVSIAILAFAEREFSTASETGPGAWPLDPIDNHYQIAEARRHADYVIVSLHGGNEWFPLPSPQMVKTCRYLVDSGASAVVSHHTHVASGIEIFGGAPIVYGTGNFLFEWPITMPAAWYRGNMVSLTFRLGHRVGVELIPYVQCREELGVHLMVGEEAAEFSREIERLSATITDADALGDAWQDFCRGKQREYIAKLVASNRLADTLWSRGLLPVGLLKKRALMLLNLVRCQSHRNVLIEVLEQISGGTGR